MRVAIAISRSSNAPPLCPLEGWLSSPWAIGIRVVNAGEARYRRNNGQAAHFDSSAGRQMFFLSTPPKVSKEILGYSAKPGRRSGKMRVIHLNY